MTDEKTDTTWTVFVPVRGTVTIEVSTLTPITAEHAEALAAKYMGAFAGPDADDDTQFDEVESDLEFDPRD